MPPALEYLPFYEGVMDLWSPVAPGSLGVGRKIFVFYTVTRHVICASKCARECGKTDNGESEGKSSRSTVWASNFGAGASRDGTLYIAVVFSTPAGTLSMVTIELMLDISKS